MENSYKKIINYIKGGASPKAYTITLYVNLAFLFSFIFIAMALYEGGYSITTKAVSSLDNLNTNPKGRWFFEIGFIVAGLWFIPCSFHILHTFADYNKLIGYISGVLYIIAGTGMIIVALSPMRVSNNLHIFGALLGFGSLIVAAFLSVLVFFIKIFKDFNKRTLIIGLIFYLPLIIVVILAGIFLGIPFLEQGTLVDYELFEWNMFFTGLFSTIGTQLLFVRKENTDILDLQ